MHHPAEDIISEALASTDEDCVLHLFSKLCTDMENSTLSASILRCLERHDRIGTEIWRAEIVSKALMSENIEMQDCMYRNFGVITV
ncbi:MAG: hypothetical protein OXF06_11480 [Bacteroidetes bacterium]|nr:hypothetical protein [Bacteroidota bacterium]